MIDLVLATAILAAALGSGLVAGVFFAFSVFVMRALVRLPAAQGIAAMQHINKVILRTAFIPLFIGTAALGVLLAAWGGANIELVAAHWLIAAGALYVFGCFLVTLRANVPRNDALERLDPADAASEPVWRDYVRTWTRWNHLRTLAAGLASLCYMLAL